MKLTNSPLYATVLLAASAFALPAQAGKTLDAIKAKGQLACGVNPGLQGFAAVDSQGNWNGIDVDICKAVAAAVLSDPTKIKWVPLNSVQRFAALQSGEIDILSRNTTWTLTRDASLGLNFTGTMFYDGQAFMVRKPKADSGNKKAGAAITSIKQLKGATVCVRAGTTTEKNLTEYSRANGLNLKPVVYESQEATDKAYFSGRCQAYTSDASNLASVRSAQAANPEEHVVLPELISKEPFSPSVRRGDDEFFTIVKWVVYAMIEAEEYGITSANADELKANSKDPAIQRILGAGEDMGRLLGLDKDWSYRVIKSEGNYGEVFERNIGAKSLLKLNRGLNNLWNKGGLMYAPPLR
jgi:general L-amino acid transport system substrate-binding protein